MLPSSPRAHPRGLPSAPRSRSTGPSRQNARHSENPDVPLPSSRQIKHQSTRSMASFPREPSRTRPPQSLPREPSRSRAPSESSRGGWQRKYTPQSQSSYDSEITAPRASQDSDSTASSVSSLFDRVRNGAASYASSFTSIEDNGNDVDEERRGRSLRKQRVISPEPSPQDPERTDTGTGDGYTVWSRVAAAASSLTISVSKAWASNITMYAGEETPPGEESRLCRAMKAYHLSKCQERQDLPSWLFSESERIPRSRTRPLRSEVAEPIPKPRMRNRHFPESESATSASNVYQSIRQDTEQPTPKASTDRLRRLREAKRQATTQAEQPRPPSAYTEPRQRVGLPAGPAQRRR